jgi:hypothetical protein
VNEKTAAHTRIDKKRMREQWEDEWLAASADLMGVV